MLCSQFIDLNMSVIFNTRRSCSIFWTGNAEYTAHIRGNGHHDASIEEKDSFLQAGGSAAARCQALGQKYGDLCHRTESVSKYEGPTLSKTSENLRQLRQDVEQHVLETEAKVEADVNLRLEIPQSFNNQKKLLEQNVLPGAQEVAMEDWMLDDKENLKSAPTTKSKRANKNASSKISSEDKGPASREDIRRAKAALRRFVAEVTEKSLPDSKTLDRYSFFKKARSAQLWQQCLALRRSFVEEEKCQSHLFNHPDQAESNARHDYAHQYMRTFFRQDVDAAVDVAYGLILRQQALLRLHKFGEEKIKSLDSTAERSQTNINPFTVLAEADSAEQSRPLSSETAAAKSETASEKIPWWKDLQVKTERLELEYKRLTKYAETDGDAELIDSDDAGYATDKQLKDTGAVSNFKALVLLRVMEDLEKLDEERRTLVDEAQQAIAGLQTGDRKPKAKGKQKDKTKAAAAVETRDVEMLEFIERTLENARQTCIDTVEKKQTETVKERDLETV